MGLYEGIKDVAKVELIGLQDQKIWIEISNTKAIQLGVPVMAIQQALQQQNATTQSGFFETSSEIIPNGFNSSEGKSTTIWLSYISFICFSVRFFIFILYSKSDYFDDAFSTASSMLPTM